MGLLEIEMKKKEEKELTMEVRVLVFNGKIVILILQWLFSHLIKYDTLINNLIFFIDFFLA
jgi:hypothetical protein